MLRNFRAGRQARDHQKKKKKKDQRKASGHFVGVGSPVLNRLLTSSRLSSSNLDAAAKRGNNLEPNDKWQKINAKLITGVVRNGDKRATEEANRCHVVLVEIRDFKYSSVECDERINTIQGGQYFYIFESRYRLHLFGMVSAVQFLGNKKTIKSAIFQFCYIFWGVFLLVLKIKAALLV